MEPALVMTLDAESLEDHLRRAREGDPDAFAPVVAATQARLRAFLAGYVARWDWVDDLAQQTYISAFRSLHAYQPETDFFRWLRAIAYNHLRAELERAARRRRIDVRAAAELEKRLEQGADEELDTLRECVDQLPESARQMIDRRYRDGQALSEIGASLGRSVDGLKVALFKIRAQLRECVKRKRAASDAGVS